MLPAADAVFADDLGRRQIRPKAFRYDLALLLRCPNTAALASCDHLDARTASALMTYLMSVLSVRRSVSRGQWR
jgi:hypothetical protein